MAFAVTPTAVSTNDCKVKMDMLGRKVSLKWHGF
jgi:hypothetical protein